MGCIGSSMPVEPQEHKKEAKKEPPKFVVEQPNLAGSHVQATNNSSNKTQNPTAAVSQPCASVEQPVALVERPLALVGSAHLDVRRPASEVPFSLELRLQKADLLTEVEVIWNQSPKLPRPLELLLDGSTEAAACSLLQEGEIPAADGAGLFRCRLQLREPLPSVRAATLRVLARPGPAKADGAEAVHVLRVVARGLPAGSPAPERRLVRPPQYWLAQSGGSRRVDVCDASHVGVFQRLLDETWTGRTTRDRKGSMPHRLLVRKVQRLESTDLWNRFSRCKRQMALARPRGQCTPLEDLRGSGKPSPVRTQQICEAVPELMGPCDRSVNEHYLFHGTSPANALGILQDGFDMRRAGAGTLFGPGAYFAEASSKCDEYAHADEFSGMYAALFCRVLCGEMLLATRKLGPAIVNGRDFADKYDGVLGDREASVGTYREFVVFRQEQVYPEYVIFYDREQQH